MHLCKYALDTVIWARGRAVRKFAFFGQKELSSNFTIVDFPGIWLLDYIGRGKRSQCTAPLESA